MCSINDLIKELNKETEVYLKHIHDTTHQYKALVSLRKNLSMNEVMLVCDFSENYNCKYSSEIQSVHFGASLKQISLHTDAFFYKPSLNEEVKCVSFCSVSENLRHDASAIWAHLTPIFNEIRKLVPRVTTIHYQSDGPTTQYRNKSNFWLFKTHNELLNLSYATWNFTTPGHGKSVADGIGGSVKGLCNRAVCQGISRSRCYFSY
ncbi:hypothetical protein ALC57_16736 [Trachymyrmex cornetzi]|uniref:Uncharacterized protein n=1 Tax=Trachymyrmex cornetzi TaxID=471704 RepID=A0A151IUI2_9HYME|nr:hypothetical protein ALC57_16736 [Trachymyrmex cornetzi]